MSDTSSQQQEPSMEEILASIRRIISEDSEEADGAAPKDAAADEVVDEADDGDDDDVLELTEVAPDEDTALEPDPEPEPEPQPTIVEEEERDEPAVIEEPEPEEPVTVAEDESESILSEAPAAQAADAIAGLMARVQSQTQLGNADLTIEQLTKDLLRPLLKEWLDANLPAMVERIVSDEIERVVAKSMKK